MKRKEYELLLPCATFIGGLLLGKILWNDDSNVIAQNTPSVSPKLVRNDIKTSLSAPNNDMEKKHDADLFPQDNLKGKDKPHKLDLKATGNSVTQNRFNPYKESELFEEPKLFWHSKLYLSQSEDTKLDAIDELVNLGETELLGSGMGDDSIVVRRATIRGLSQIATEDSVQILGQAFFSTKDESLRQDIVDALQSLSYLENAQVFLAIAHQSDLK